MPAPSPSLSFTATLQVTPIVASVATGRSSASASRLARRTASGRVGACSAATECTGATPSPFQLGSKRSRWVGSCRSVPGSTAPALRIGEAPVSSCSGASSPNWASSRHVTSGRNHGVSSLISAVSSPRDGCAPTTRKSMRALTPMRRKPNRMKRIPASIVITAA